MMSGDTLRNVFHKHGLKEIPGGHHEMRLPDGSELELHLHGQLDAINVMSVLFFPRSESESTLHFIFECAKSTGGFLLPMIDGNPYQLACIILEPSQRKDLPYFWKRLIVVECGSAEEFMRVLRDEGEAWIRERNRVLPQWML